MIGKPIFTPLNLNFRTVWRLIRIENRALTSYDYFPRVEPSLCKSGTLAPFYNGLRSTFNSSPLAAVLSNELIALGDAMIVFNTLVVFAFGSGAFVFSVK